MSVNKKYEMGVAVMVFPFVSDLIYAIGGKLARIISQSTRDVFFISGEIPDGYIWPKNVQLIDVGIRLHALKNVRPRGYSALLWIGKVIFIQIWMAIEIAKNRARIDVVMNIFGSYYQLPFLVAKLLGKKVMFFVGAGPDSLARIMYGDLIYFLLKTVTAFNYMIADKIIVESLRLGEEEVLKRWRSKLSNGAMYFGDGNVFKVINPVEDREDVIGFVGRMNTQKSILEFLEALPLVLQTYPKLKCYIIGSGMLDDEVDRLIQQKALTESVIRKHWVENEEMPEYLNKFKLLALPSKKEGLPNILLEAVSCGTPVVATMVGGIPDLIINGETGFALDTITPREIADKIIYALSDPSCLSKVSIAAKDLLLKHYSLEASIKRYSDIFDDLIIH